MPTNRISFHPGNPSFMEIHVTTSAPLDWLVLVRPALASLLDCFHAPLPANADGMRGYGIWLLYSLYPLPAQIKAGTAALDTPPGTNEQEGYYFTPDGLVLRLQIAASFEELDSTLRALLAIGQYSGHSLADEMRMGYFELLGAFISSSADAR